MNQNQLDFSTMAPLPTALIMELFHSLAVHAHSIAKAKGWDDEPRTFGDKISLMHSELSEALEGFRHGNPPSSHIPDFTAIEEELADVIIRILHYSSEAHIRLGAAILAKLDYNSTRSHRHGGKVI